MTLVPGVYSFSTSAQLTGTLTLDAEGDPAAVFILKIGSTLTTAAGSIVSTINEASYANVFWQVGTSATLGIGSSFAGNILAMASITATTGASVKGRLLARTGAVTLDTNAIENGEPLATLHVIKHVVNNNGGTHVAADFPMGVSFGLPLNHVTGSPAPGAESPGTAYLLPAGTYYVWEDGMGYNYTATYSGDSVAGWITLAPGDVKTVTITNDDNAIIPPIAPLINITKVPNPLALPVGPGNVTYTYTVTNPGTVALSNVTVTDDKVTPVSYVSGDANTDNLLQSSEAWLYTGTKYIDVTTTNIATASGSANSMTATDTASATVVVTPLVPPLINVVKTPNPLALLSGPGNVTYTYTVTNPGTVALSNLTVTDDKVTPVSYISGDVNVDNKLQAGEAWVYTATKYIDVTTTNTATASGSANSMTATDTASATVVVTPLVPPLINDVKTPNPLALPLGPGNVTYTYMVTNPGTVDLSNVNVTDDKVTPVSYVSGDVNTDNLLQSSETWVYTAAKYVDVTTTNTATASGRANGMTVTDTASATVVMTPLVPPLINVVKTPNPLSMLLGPGSVTYTYRVTNPGTVELSNVTVTDDKITPVSYVSGDVNTDNKLQAGEAWVYTATKYIDVTTTNIAAASGDANGMTAKDTASATVIVAPVVPPLINIVKIPDPLALLAGPGPVTYTYKITSPGTVALNNVTVTDDKVTPVSYVSGDINTDNLLQASETWVYTGTEYIEVTTTNIATATGRANGMTATDTALATVVVTQIVPPLINVVKTPNPLVLTAGSGKVTYAYAVTNPGTVRLSNVRVADDKISLISYISGDVNADGFLQHGEVWIYSGTMTLSETTTNTVTATGSANGLTAADTAVATVVVSGGVLPDTATPWYNLFIAGAAILIIGILLWIKKESISKAK